MLVLVLVVVLTAATATMQPIPSVLYGSLFKAVQMGQLFPDQKTFADAVPLLPPSEIMSQWMNTTESLSSFVSKRFYLPASPPIEPPAGQSLEEHIDWLWPRLTRWSLQSNSSLVALPNAYVVPGSRFREGYYWDSYFTFVGLVHFNRSVVEGMIDNFVSLLDSVGFIANGNRNYYQSRSQPPMFSFMVTDYSQRPPSVFAAALAKEYDYWMSGSRVVKMRDGSLLNRYWDDLDIPRDESYLEDVTTCQQCGGGGGGGLDCAALFRNIRTAAMSGWDFSSRWLKSKNDNSSLCSIATTSIVPVDLNSLLFHLETVLAKVCQSGATDCRAQFEQAAAARADAMHRFLWCDTFYCDYDLDAERGVKENPTPAMMFPLMVGLAADPKYANATVETLLKSLLRPGGVMTSTFSTGQQWDAPYGWAPLQWVTMLGMEKYGMHQLARVVGNRFMASVNAVYSSQSKLIEKYNVETIGAGGGGEYPLQDGFGWTNGVVIGILNRTNII